MAKTIGYVKCLHCGGYTHIKNPKDVKIFYHPDDVYSTVAVLCRACNGTTISRISWEHARNFQIHGVKTHTYNELFPVLKEEDIDEWNVVKELEELLDDEAE